MKTMKKSLKLFLIALLIVPCMFMLSACGDDDSDDTKGLKTTYNANFTTEDKALSVFSDSLGGVGYNKDAKTITLFKAGDKDQGPNTYFGETDKNLDWDSDGTIVSIKLNIDSSDYAIGEGFNYTVAVNGNDGEFVSERSIYVRKYEEGVKVGYIYNGSSDQINQSATSSDDAKVLEDGWYTFKFDFHKNAQDLAKVTIGVVNDQNETVFEVVDAKLNKSDDSDIDEDEVLGLRYGWFSWMTVDSIECSALTVQEIN